MNHLQNPQENNESVEVTNIDPFAPRNQIKRPESLMGLPPAYNDGAMAKSMQITGGTTKTAVNTLIKNGSIPNPSQQPQLQAQLQRPHESQGRAVMSSYNPADGTISQPTTNYNAPGELSDQLRRRIESFKNDGSVYVKKLELMLSTICDFMKDFEVSNKEIRAELERMRANQNGNPQTQGFMMPAGEPTYYDPKLVNAMKKFKAIHGDNHNLTIVGQLIELVRYTDSPNWVSLIDLAVDTHTMRPKLKVLCPFNHENSKTWKFDDETREKYETDDIALMSLFDDVFKWLWRSPSYRSAS